MATATRTRSKGRNRKPTPAKTSPDERGEQTRNKIKAFIQSYWAANGVAPTLMEIAEGVGLSAHAGVRTHLFVLQNRGEITWQPGKTRTVRLVSPAA